MTGINGTIYLGAAFCYLLLIDNFGRRKSVTAPSLPVSLHTNRRGRMMLYGSTTMGSCHLIAAMCLCAAENDPSQKKIVSKQDRPDECWTLPEVPAG
jgi:hypothetical protein